MGLLLLVWGEDSGGGSVGREESRVGLGSRVGGREEDGSSER